MHWWTLIGCDKSIAWYSPWTGNTELNMYCNSFYSFIIHNSCFFFYFQIYNFRSIWVMSLKIIHSWKTIHCNRCTGVWLHWIDARKCDWTAVHTSMEQIMWVYFGFNGVAAKACGVFIDTIRIRRISLGSACPNELNAILQPSSERPTTHEKFNRGQVTNADTNTLCTVHGLLHPFAYDTIPTSVSIWRLNRNKFEVMRNSFQVLLFFSRNSNQTLKYIEKMRSISIFHTQPNPLSRCSNIHFVADAKNTEI